MAEDRERFTEIQNRPQDSDDVGLDRLPPPPRARAGETTVDTPVFPMPGPEPLPTLPGFEILGLLGRGGMGTVYRARELHLNRVVAVKMLRSGELAQPEERARFLNEAQALAGLQHPHIVQVFQGGEAHGRLYLVMECVEGGSLDRHLRGRPLSPETAAAVVEVLARTVAYVHGRGLLHRDLKLANILVAGAPEQALGEQALAAAAVKITDFGLAKRFEKDQDAAATRTIVGTPSYMAPEQACGQPASPAADVYALGAVLYELLTGRPPFTGSTWIETVEQVLRADPIAPRRLNAALPRDLETICMRCLRKEPARRYATATALADDLQRFLTGQPIQARPTGLWDKTIKWVRRRPAVAALLALLAAVTITGIILVTWKWLEAVQANRDLVQSQSQKLSAREALVRAQVAGEAAKEEAARNRARDHALTFADRAWLSNHPQRCQEWLSQCPPDLRRWEWNFFRERLHAGQTILHTDYLETNHVAFSPDGALLASGSGVMENPKADNDVKIWNSAAGKLLFRLKGHKGPITWSGFHPKQKVLVSLSTRLDWLELVRGNVAALRDITGECIVWDLATKARLATIPGCFGVGDFSADGKYFAAPGAGQMVRIWDASSPWPWKEIVKLPPYEGLVKQVAFSPDGKLLARAGANTRGLERGRFDIDAELTLWHTVTGKKERAIAVPPVELNALAFHPKGRILAWGNGAQNTATLWDLDTNQPLRTLFGHEGTILSLAFHANGKWLASAGNDRAVKVWDVTTGQNLHTLRGHTRLIRHVAFAPPQSGLVRSLASAAADGTVRLWDPVHGQDPVTLRGHTMAVTHIAYSPDGRLLASRGAGGPVKIWGADNKLLRTLDSFAEHIAFSPDSKRLVSCGGNPLTPHLPGELIIWDAGTGQRVHTLAGHSKHVGTVAWSPDGARIVSASGDPMATPPLVGEVIWWDARSGKEVLRLKPPLGMVTALQYSPDGKLLAAGTYALGTYLLDPSTGKEVRQLGGHSREVSCLAFSRDGRKLASGDLGGTCVLWDVAGGQRKMSLPASADSLLTIAFHPDGDRLVTASYDMVERGRGDLRLWDATSGQEIMSLPGQAAVAFRPDGRKLAAAAVGSVSQPGAIHIWDAPPTPELATWLTSNALLFGVAFTPDGREIVVANMNTSGESTVTFYDLATQKQTRALPTQGPAIAQLAFSSNNTRRLATAHGDGSAKIWDLDGPRGLFSLKGHTAWVSRIRFSPDGATLATASHDATIKLWDAADGKLRHSWKAHEGKIFDLLYSPDGALLASAGGDKLVHLWDADSRKPIRVFKGHTAVPACLAFQPSGALLAAGDWDKTIILWDRNAGEPWARLNGHTEVIRAILFSQDGKHLFSAGDDQTIKVWNVAQKKEIASFHAHYDLVRSLALHPNGQWLASASYDRNLKLWTLADMLKAGK